MPVNSKRAKEIDTYISSHSSCIKSPQPIEIKGKIEFLPSFMLPIKLEKDAPYFLQYNHENRRFNLEIQEYETQNKRRLNPADNTDALIIRGLLLQDTIEAEKLYKDLEQLGQQREVAAITHDGIVVNGNRRMATIEQLHAIYPSKWEELWVVRLPADISEKDLWKIEAGLQLSKEKVADYGPINNLLMIKEGRKAGLSEAEIAASMYGWEEETVKYELERLELIDTFLMFMSQGGNYGLIKRFRLNEHFQDIQKYLVKALLKKGVKKKDLLPLLEEVFLHLRAHIINQDHNVTHYQVRDICKLLLEPNTRAELTESFSKFKNPLDIPVELLTNNFDNAMEAKKNREEKDKPGKLLERAISALKNIDRKGNHYKQDIDVKEKVKVLDSIVRDIKKELGLV